MGCTMPFENSVAHSFSVSSIRSHAPAGPGVYGISNAREWILIGCSDNIQGTLMERLREQNTFFAGRCPTGFVYEICYSSDVQAARQHRLIEQYAPICNQTRNAR